MALIVEAVAPVRLIVLDAALAAQVAGPRLRPRPIVAGPQAGAFALSTAVLDDPEHATCRAALAAAPQAEIDPALAWPEAD